MAKYKCETLGLMIDVSRNACMSLDGWRRFMPLIAKMGYNAIFLYMEDNYEVEGEPFFGYMRAKYTISEMREIEALGEQYGVEIIPCIQTLAHLDQIFKWKVYPKDNTDILMVGDDRTYELIDNMFKTLSRIFKTRRIHIGMDEAHGLGKGRYHDVYGCENEGVIMRRHLNRVKELAEKYGYEVLMWSDMFFRGWNGGKYYCGRTEIPEDYKSALPDGVAPVYWDYYWYDESRYADMIDNHKQLSDKLWFAGGVWTWLGFSPDNAYTLKTMIPAINVCRKEKVKNVMFTLWGDCGGECPRFSVLPSMFYLAELMRGNDDSVKIKAKFKRLFGMDYDEFCLLDLPVRYALDQPFECSSVSKHMLYSDCLNGHLDFTVRRGGNEYYKESALKLRAVAKKSRKYGYLFDTAARLSEILSHKYELGVKTRAAYKAGDKDELRRLLIEDYDRIIKLLPGFIKSYKKQWLAENKYAGFDVQEYRLGGLLTRMISVRARIADYLEGRIGSIEELECDVMPFGGMKEGISPFYIRHLVTYTSNLTE